MKTLYTDRQTDRDRPDPTRHDYTRSNQTIPDSNAGFMIHDSRYCRRCPQCDECKLYKSLGEFEFYPNRNKHARCRLCEHPKCAVCKYEHQLRSSQCMHTIKSMVIGSVGARKNASLHLDVLAKMYPRRRRTENGLLNRDRSRRVPPRSPQIEILSVWKMRSASFAEGEDGVS
jgi:hypothetical protein